MANEIKNEPENTTEKIKELDDFDFDADFDYKRAYLYVCSELSDAIDRYRRVLLIAESICIRDGIRREDIMPD